MSLVIEILVLTLVGAWTVYIWKKEWTEIHNAWISRAFKLLPMAIVKLGGDIFLTQFIVKTFGIGGSKAAVAFGLILSNLVSYAFFMPKKAKKARKK